VNDLFARTGVGIAHHQIDVFLFAPGPTPISAGSAAKAAALGGATRPSA